MGNLTSYNYCKETVNLVQKVQEGFVYLAERLHKIKTERLWEDGYSSWEEFCDETRLSYSTVQKLIQIYDTFVLTYGFKTSEIASKGGWSILAEGLPIIKSKSDAQAFLEQAEVLSLRDIRKTITARKKGIPEDSTCTHEDSYIIRICNHCGERIRVYEEEISSSSDNV